MTDRPDGGRSRQIAADIGRTRDALDRTVDAIVGKLTPSQLLMECVQVFRSGSSSVLSRVVETAREHPVPATIVAAGVGMMLWERFSGGSGGRVAAYRPAEIDTEVDDYDYDYEGGYGYEGRGRGRMGRMKQKARAATSDVAETVADVKDTVREKAQQATERVRERAEQAREKVDETLEGVRETTRQAREAVRETLHGVKEEAAHARESARRRVKDARIGFWQTMDRQPLVVGGIALALGAATALLIPGTDTEAELMGDARERLKERAEDVGRQVLEKGKQVARTAAETLRDEAREQGLAPDQLADKVKTVVRETQQKTVQTAEQELEPVLAGSATPGTGGSNMGGPGAGNLDRG
jgi:hypothetical protein